MLRLIDIVLILLFGFISISHVDRAWEVDLPQASFVPELPPDFEDWVVVAVADEGFVCGAERLRLPNEIALGAWLAREAAAGATHVRLRADREHESRIVSSVAALCEGLDLDLALEIRLASSTLGADGAGREAGQ